MRTQRAKAKPSESGLSAGTAVPWEANQDGQFLWFSLRRRSFQKPPRVQWRGDGLEEELTQVGTAVARPSRRYTVLPFEHASDRRSSVRHGAKAFVRRSRTRANTARR